MKTSAIVGISLGIFAAYLPIAHWLHFDYVAPPRPVGMAEPISGFIRNEQGYWTVRLYLFNEKTHSDPKSIAVLEDMMPLHFVEAYLDKPTTSFFILFKTDDGSNPNKNGRRYWAVRQ